MKTIAMTGASGFIGQHLLRHYLEEGAHVIAFVPDPENMGEFTKYPNFELVKAFFEDFDHLSELTQTRDIEWNMGTCIIIRSAVDRSMQSPMAFPLLTTL